MPGAHDSNGNPASITWRWLGVQPATVGTIFCGLSAVLYALAAVCLRQLADMPLDTALVIAVKETVTVVAVGPWLAWQLFRRQRLCKSSWYLVALIVVGLLTQIVGNLNQMRAFGLIGLTVAMPIIFAGILIGGAVFGLIFLRESISKRSLIAIGLLILSIILLRSGVSSEVKQPPTTAALDSVASETHATSLSRGRLAATAADPSSPGPIAPNAGAERFGSGLLAALLAGLTFAVLGVSVRHWSQQGVSIGLVMFVVTACGTVSMGIIGGARSGFTLLQTAPVDLWAWMLASGVFNFFAFLSLNYGLGLTKIVRANILNASQVAIAALFGILFFGEEWGLVLIAGLVLTIIGITLITPPDSDEVEVEL